MRTPFRYPGSKNKIVSAIIGQMDGMKAWADANTFVDAFVGGGSVFIAVKNSNRMEKPDLKFTVNDLDEWVYSFWYVIAKKLLVDELCDIVKETVPTVELFNDLRNTEPEGAVQKAFYAIFFNRTTFSGIFNSGPIGGYEQKSKWGVDCRYNSDEIVKRIKALHKGFKGNLSVRKQNFDKVLKGAFNRPFFYLDPPYYHKGDSLYRERMDDSDHALLADILNDMDDNWLLSYDDCEEIRDLYSWAKIVDFDVNYCINGEKKDWKKKQELLILPK